MKKILNKILDKKIGELTLTDILALQGLTALGMLAVLLMFTTLNILVA
jgi:hypothetical protein